jgi:hypothetical protein
MTILGSTSPPSHRLLYKQRRQPLRRIVERGVRLFQHGRDSCGEGPAPRPPRIHRSSRARRYRAARRLLKRLSRPSVVLLFMKRAHGAGPKRGVVGQTREVVVAEEGRADQVGFIARQGEVNQQQPARKISNSLTISIGRPVDASQMRAVPSSPAVRTRVPRKSNSASQTDAPTSEEVTTRAPSGPPFRLTRKESRLYTLDEPRGGSARQSRMNRIASRHRICAGEHLARVTACRCSDITRACLSPFRAANSFAPVLAWSPYPV